jgi:hypothetical protein
VFSKDMEQRSVFSKDMEKKYFGFIWQNVTIVASQIAKNIRKMMFIN